MKGENRLRHENIKTLFPENECINYEYSNYNIAMNKSFLFDSRNLLLHSKTYIEAFYVASIFVSDPSLYSDFINFISSSNEVFTINDIIEKVFKISEIDVLSRGSRLLLDFIQRIKE